MAETSNRPLLIKKSVGRHETYCNHFVCPKRGCNYDGIVEHDNYCAQCGQSLLWPLHNKDVEKIPGYKE